MFCCSNLICLRYQFDLFEIQGMPLLLRECSQSALANYGFFQTMEWNSWARRVCEHFDSKTVCYLDLQKKMQSRDRETHLAFQSVASCMLGFQGQTTVSLAKSNLYVYVLCIWGLYICLCSSWHAMCLAVSGSSYGTTRENCWTTRENCCVSARRSCCQIGNDPEHSFGHITFSVQHKCITGSKNLIQIPLIARYNKWDGMGLMVWCLTCHTADPDVYLEPLNEFDGAGSRKSAPGFYVWLLIDMFMYIINVWGCHQVLQQQLDVMQ